MDNLHEISLRERIRLNLNFAMEQANISQVQLAEKLGISKGTVNNWARGNNSPDVDMVPRICSVLGISILDLFSPAKFEFPENTQTPKSSGTGESSINPLRDTLLRNFDQLNEEGQERLVETSDDMVSSGKYIKTSSYELGKAKLA